MPDALTIASLYFAIGSLIWFIAFNFGRLHHVSGCSRAALIVISLYVIFVWPDLLWQMARRARGRA